ncbi:potassium channel family protein [Faecalibaculum rodentium]|uniref:potassium channel family protein n=1 Tax=Faecalibaculum rodentium TaxID=1702221 RepID=UPI0027301A4E|nr:potassium channel family protein [Faecalibaculum rodentium]
MEQLSKRIREIQSSGPYNVIICLLAVISVVLAITDMTTGLSPQAEFVDSVIYWLFVADYTAGFLAAESKANFFKHSILDLIAILPFSSALRIFRTFKAFRIMRLAKLTKLVKLARIGGVLGRLVGKSRRFLDTNGFKYVLILSACAVILSSVMMTYFEGMPFEDAVWWSFVTATTVGYGDLSPVTPIGRFIAAALMLVGIGLIGSLTSTITSYFIDRKPVQQHSTDKVEMVVTMYESLSDTEKEDFRSRI